MTIPESLGKGAVRTSGWNRPGWNLAWVKSHGTISTMTWRIHVFDVSVSVLKCLPSWRVRGGPPVDSLIISEAGHVYWRLRCSVKHCVFTPYAHMSWWRPASSYPLSEVLHTFFTPIFCHLQDTVSSFTSLWLALLPSLWKVTLSTKSFEVVLYFNVIKVICLLLYTRVSFLALTFLTI